MYKETNKETYTDYQKKTIAHILERFQSTPPARRMLCSDEVGLGKTFVAKGVIRGMAWQYLKEGKKRLDVLYLCPNLNIAAQNKKELGIGSDNDKEIDTLAVENRSTMLYLQVLRQALAGKKNKIRADELAEQYKAATGNEPEVEDETKEITVSVFPVTPETSLKITGAGDVREREYILRMLDLCGLVTFDEVKGMIAKSGKSDMKYEYDDTFKKFHEQKKEDKFKEHIDKFKEYVEAFRSMSDKLKRGFKVYIKEQAEIWAKMRNNNDEWLLNWQWKEIWEPLRSVFARTTVQLIPYDLVIMDEFQNFTDIIDSANKNAYARKYIRCRREMIWRLLDMIKVDNEYKGWLSEQMDGFGDLVEKDEFGLDKNFENCECGIKAKMQDDKYRHEWERIDASPEGEERANNLFNELIDYLLGHSFEEEGQEQDKQWRRKWQIVTGIMDKDIPCFPGDDPKKKCEDIEKKVKKNKLDITRYYYLWERLKNNNIGNRNISKAAFYMWFYYCYYEIWVKNNYSETDNLAVLLDQIFSQEMGKNIRILMLSATPFKLYMDTWDRDKNRKKETVDTVCNFLQESGVLTGVLNEYKSSVKEFAAQKTTIESVIDKKKKFEEQITAYFTRMERSAVIRELKKALQTDNGEADEEFAAVRADEEFPAGKIDELLKYVDELAGLKIPTVSRGDAARCAIRLPYALSFMPEGNNNGNADTGYKAKKEFLKLCKEDPAPDLSNIGYSLVDKEVFDCYAEPLGVYHGVFDIVLEKILDLKDNEDKANAPGAGALLWIPPLAVKKDDLEGAFKEHYGYGKSIIFSAWTMIPRGLATLISYEVRRRLLCKVFPGWMEKDTNKRKEILQKIKDRIEKIKTELKKDTREWGLWRALFAAADTKIPDPYADISVLLAVWSQTAFEGKERIDPLDKDTDWDIEQIKKYSKMGRLDKVLEEYTYMSKNENNEFDFVKSSKLKIHVRVDDKVEEYTPRSFFARGIGSSKDDDKINAIKNLQAAFNSPFYPFVFATTSMGQEGLNFHAYADKVIHWNLPSNPVDFEQREGRINRRNCFMIRRKLIEKYLENELETCNNASEVFDKLFEKVKTEWVDNSNSDLVKCGMIPNWILPYKDENDKVRFAGITRIVPYFILDDQLRNYHKNLQILQLYRAVIGQPDPEELLERLVGNDKKEEAEKLFLDFSPYNKFQRLGNETA